MILDVERAAHVDGECEVDCEHPDCAWGDVVDDLAQLLPGQLLESPETVACWYEFARLEPVWL